MKRLCIGQEVVDWVARRTNEHGSFGGDAKGIGLLKDGVLIAGVAYGDYNGANVVAHIASDGSKRWMTREFLKVIFDYPFNQLRCRRITCLVGSGNTASRRLCEHFGFVLEANLRGAHLTGDLLVYCMFSEDCRWITAASYKPLAKAA